MTKRITELPVASSVTGNEAVPIVQDGETRQALLSRFSDYQITDAEVAAGVTPTDYQYPPGDVRRYGAVDDNSTDCSAAFQMAANAGHIIIPTSSSKWALSSSVALSVPCTIVAHGRAGAVRQSSWGVPAFEVRSADVSILGRLYVEYTGSRTTFDVAALDFSANSETVKAEASGDPKAAGSAIYCRNTADNLYIEHLDVYGFIAGILAASNDDVSIGQITVENVDFGTFGAPGKGWQIGAVNASDINRSQGVDPHAVYFPGTATAISYGLQIGRVTCDSVSDGAHVVSLKYAKNFTIGEISGHTDVGSALTLLECTGSVGIVEFTASKIPTNDDPSSCVLVQSNSNVTLDIARISCRQQTGTSNAGVNCTGGSTLNINHLDLTMADATAAKGVRSSGTARVSSAIVTYSATQTEYAFLAAADGYIRIDTPPQLIGGSLLLNCTATGTYDLAYNPDLIGTLSETTIVVDDGEYTTAFIGGSSFVNSGVDNDATPQVRHTSRLNIAYTGNGVTITNFDSGSPGQEIWVLFSHTFNGGAAGAITVDFTGTTLKGNAGSDWQPKAGDILHGVFNGTNWYCQVIDTTA